MATLDKLVISGIRSFNPEEDPQVIKFSSPLTLFLGQNGCGKTTIMECLKYACSGELPGGSNRGQGFLYDPKMNGTTLTKGQVKLKFSDEKHNKYTVFKSMTVTAKKDSLKFSKLDSSLKIKAPDQTDENVISGRCLDIENTVSELLGVSRSVLNNVIFCHQEDSLWPLDEGSKLKKKFDEIFEATRYHKCTDSIRKLIKDKSNKIKLLEYELSDCEYKKKEAEKKQSSLTEKEEKCQNIAKEIFEKEEKLKPAKIRLQEICELQTKLSDLQSELSAKITENKSLTEQSQTLLKNMKGKEYKGTDAELQSEIKNFDQNRQNVEDKLKKCDKEKTNIEKQESLLIQKKSKLLADLGKLKLEKKNHIETINKRKATILNICNNLKIDIMDLKEDINVENELELIKDGMEKLRLSIEKLSTDLDVKEQKLQSEIDNCRDNVNKTKHSIESKRNLIEEYKKKSRDINSQLDELNVSDDQLRSLKNKIESIDKELQVVNDKFQDQGITQSRIEKQKSDIKKLEEKLEELEEEMKMLQKNSTIETEIEIRKFEIKKKENEIRKLKNKHHNNLQLLFSNNVPTKNLKSAVEAIRNENTKKVNDLTNNINNYQKTLSRQEAQLKFAKQKLQSYEQELNTCKKRIQDHCKGVDYDKVKDDLITVTEKLRKAKGKYQSAKIMYESFIEQFEEDKCCPLCRTQFSKQKEVLVEIVSDLKQKICEIPSKLKEVEEDLKQKETELNKVIELGPLNAKIFKLSKEDIPAVMLEIESLNSDCEQLNASLCESRDKLKVPQKLEHASNEVLGDAALIDQCHTEISSYEALLENLSTRIIKVNSQRTKQETETEIENAKMDLSNARRNYENLLKKLQQYNNRCQDLRETKSKYIQEQLDIQKVMQGKPQLEEQLVDLSEKVEQFERDVEELELSLVPLKLDLEEAERKKNVLKEENKRRLDKAKTEMFQNEKLLDNIEKYNKEITEYIRENKEAAFEEAVEKSVQIEELLGNLADSKAKIIEEISEIKKEHGSLELQYRILIDNLELREKQNKQTVIGEEIKILKGKIGNYDEHSLLNEKLKLEMEHSKINQDINNCKGRKAELEASIREIKAELEQPELKLADSKHKSKYYEVKVIQQATKDLENFLKALEYSIMHFHKERMVQINKTIREYWRSIYKGNDIDYIEIKTEQDSSLSGKKRIYNYKVIQVKNDIELEMRGRCSAGQKVLASIIIRMALAETFSRKCGILALDEPTTNLDRANILSLSEALANIVNARSCEKNFQLLVITHDEEFLNALTTIDKVSFINRVTRNENGNSIVRLEHL